MSRIQMRTLQAMLALFVCFGWLGHSARAEFAHTLLERTAGLFALFPHWQSSSPRALQLNGARIIVTTGTSEQPIGVMLDHFQAECRAHSGGLHEAAERVFAPPAASLPSMLDGVLRVQDGDVGLVACLAIGKATLSAAAWADRIARFTEALDLQVFGGVRLVRVQQAGSRTFFTAVWNDGPVPLGTMFPEQGDSPGYDVVGVLRPSGAQRVLSAFQEGEPTGVQVYRVQDDVDTAFSGYATALSAAGWSIHDPAFLASSQAHAALFLRGDSSVVVYAEEQAGERLLSVLSLGEKRAKLEGGPSLAPARR